MSIIAHSISYEHMDAVVAMLGKTRFSNFSDLGLLKLTRKELPVISSIDLVMKGASVYFTTLN